MLALKKVAVTGNLASGKSTVCRFFKNKGAYVLDTDRIVHELIHDSSEIQQKLTELFGNKILTDGSPDRKKIAKIVFNNPKLLQQLEAVLHPEVRGVVEEEFKKISNEKHWTLFVVEIPLLFETAPIDFYDTTLAVIADPAVRKKWFLERGVKEADQFDKRQARLMPDEEKANRADFVIYNNGDLEKLEQTSNEIYSQLIQ